jgi:hypothetical protein
VAVGLNPVGLFAVGFMAVGLAAAGFHATGLLTLALWRAVGLVAAGPSAIGLERIAVEKGMVGLLLVLAIVAAWLTDRLIRAIGSAAALPGGMAENKELAGASNAARASAQRACWFWLLAVVFILAILVFPLVRSSSTFGGGYVPPDKVYGYDGMTARLEALKRQEAELLQQYTPDHPKVQETRRRIDEWQRQKEGFDREFPSLGQRSALSLGVTTLKTFNPPDKPISGELTLTDDNAWAASCTTTQTFRLFEVPNPGVEQCTVLYRARLKTEGLVGRAYLEMWCQFPGKGEFFSRGLGNTISGSSDWATCQTPFFLKVGEKPDLIRLNLVVEGRGKVFIKDIELTAAPSK